MNRADGTYAIDTTWRTLLADLGVRPADALRRAGLPDDLLARPSARLPADEYYRLWSGIEREVGDPLLPLQLVQTVRAESFSPPLFAALCSPDLLVAARRIGRYKALIGPIRFDVAETANVVTIEMVWPGTIPPPASLVVMELLFCVMLARMGTREPIRPVGVTTPVPPEPQQAYTDYLGTPIRPGPAHRVIFDRTDALRPFLTANDALWATFEPDLRRRLSDLENDARTIDRVRAVLLEGLAGGLVSAEAVAARLALSKRTLQRRIEAEGSSFAAILAQTREDLSRHYLRKTRLPAAEIAFLVGFSETASFYRAFRAWTGTTPENVRATLPERQG